MTAEDVFYVLREQDMITVSDGQSGKIRAPATSKYKSRDGGVSSSNRGRKGRPQGGAAANRAAVAHKDKESALSIPSEYSIHFDRAYVVAHLKNYQNKGYLKIRPEKLKWTPFLIARAIPQSLDSDETNAQIELANAIRQAAKESAQRQQFEAEVSREEQKARFTELAPENDTPDRPDSTMEIQGEAQAASNGQVEGAAPSQVLLHQEGQPDVLLPAQPDPLPSIDPPAGGSLQSATTLERLASLKMAEEDLDAEGEVEDFLGTAGGEEDKDGEYEIDAEGELDAEGEDDIDAEGEDDEDL